MKAVVELVHMNGERLDRGVQHPRGLLRGHLGASKYANGGSVVHLYRLGEEHLKPLAMLFSPRWVGVGRDGFRLAGLERHGKAWVYQEWIIRPDTRDASGQ